MRICVNIEKDSEPRLVEEDVEIALGHLRAIPPVFRNIEWEITEHEGGTITADTEYSLDNPADIERELAEVIEEDTGAKVTVEVIEGWPPS